jgi:spermidine/putrescine transport system permease protein
MKKENNLFKTVFTTPVIIYAITLIFIPLIYILFLSFCKSDSYGGILYEFNLDNYITIFNLTYMKVFLKSFIIALITTFLCILIAYPFSLSLINKSEQVQNLIIKLVNVPFLTNSLIRIYGWIVLLRKNGIINNTLLSLNIIDEPLNLMYNYLGIIIGMTYTLLPFMILPVYSAVSKVDKSVIEAGRDLGASEFKIFKNIIFPNTIPGVFNGSLMVFIPAIAYFFITDILGGGKFMIIGNLIKNQFLTARNWPFGASLSIFLLIITFGLVALYKKIGGEMDDLGGA